MAVRNATFEDMALAADIMVTSFRTAFADFVSPKTMDACTNPRKLPCHAGEYLSGRKDALSDGW